MRGAIERANSTHIGCSGSIEPCSLITVPPLRTIAATSLKPSVSTGEFMNFTTVPKYARERSSRNMAESAVRP